MQADVDTRVGEKYELFWNPDDKEHDSTLGCKILAIEHGKFLTFEWKGPSQYESFMSTVRPLTHVTDFFAPSGENTEVHLLHSGLRDTKEWEEARQWFVRARMNALSELEKYVSSLVTVD